MAITQQTWLFPLQKAFNFLLLLFSKQEESIHLGNWLYSGVPRM